MRPTTMTVVLPVLLAGMLADTGLAQQPVQAGVRTTLPIQNALDSVRQGQVLRLAQRDVGRVQGTLLSRSEDHLVVRSRRRRTDMLVPIADVDTLWTPDNKTRNTLILMGTLTGAALGSWFIGGFSNAYETEKKSGVGAYVVGFGVGALGGLIISSVLTIPMPSWRRTFP